MVRPVYALVFAFTSVALSSAARAGSSCEERAPNAYVVQQAIAMAYDTRQKLESSGGEIALIARAGQNLSQYGVRYSHLGFVWRDHPKGAWRVVHELNECGTAASEIYDEGLGNFFLDDLWKMEGVILIPGDLMQKRIVSVLTERQHLMLHDGHYNMVAYPFSTQYQNSNQWSLEVIAFAEAVDMPVKSRRQAQQWLELAGYKPTELNLDAITRLGARVSKANVAFDDHPSQLRWSSRIRTVTADSVLTFIANREPGARLIKIVGRNLKFMADE